MLAVARLLLDGPPPNSTQVWNFLNHWRQSSCTTHNNVRLVGDVMPGGWVGVPSGWQTVNFGGAAQCCTSCSAPENAGCAGWSFENGNCTLLSAVHSRERAPWIAASVGASSRALVELVDIYPTVLDLLGVPLPTGDSVPVDGTSLRPLLEDPKAKGKALALSTFPRCAHKGMPPYGARGLKGGAGKPRHSPASSRRPARPRLSACVPRLRQFLPRGGAHFVHIHGLFDPHGPLPVHRVARVERLGPRARAAAAPSSFGALRSRRRRRRLDRPGRLREREHRRYGGEAAHFRAERAAARGVRDRVTPATVLGSCRGKALPK